MTTAEKLVQIASNVDAVYNAGYNAGLVAGTDTSALDAFWDAYQQNGARTSYAYAFAGAGWTADTFKPKYSMAPSGGCSAMFMNNQTKIDLVEYLNDLGVTLDFSAATNLQMVFQSAKFTRLGVIDASNVTSLSQTFAYSGIVTIDKLVLSETNTSYASAFASDGALKNITIEGVIAKSISFSGSSKLTLASALSIVNHLKNLTGTDITATLTLHANTWALLDADTSFPEHTPAEEGATASWKTYITDVLGWGRA